MQEELLQLFPAHRRDFWSRTTEQKKDLQEIRIRVGRPIIILLKGKEFFLSKTGELQESTDNSYCVNREELEELINHFCHYSLYAFEDEFRQGYITVSGGHRIGLAGQVVLEEGGGIRTIKNISYINIRIAHQIKGVADKVMPHLYEHGKLKNILIISPPGCGKTTLLRDIIRQVSDGNSYGVGQSVGVVDERSEIAGSWQGLPQNDIGMRTDVLDGCPKTRGMLLLLRSMSPGVIAIDELGGEEDIRALRMASFCGTGLLATIHGEGIRDVEERFLQKGLWEKDMFDIYVILGKEQGRPVIKRLIEKEEVYAETIGGKYDYRRVSGIGTVV